jgi:hypothetical protein
MLGSIRFPLTSAGVVATVAFLSTAGANAQGDEEEFDRTPRDCLAVSRIRSTDILDDRTILFFLRGNKLVFRTYLPRECPGLERNDRFAYEARNGQLCDVDVITVLEQMGVSLSPTFTCRLGKFIPITAEEAEDLKLDRTDERLKRKAIAAEPVELPPDKQETQDAGDAAADDATSAPASSEPAPAAPAKKAPPRGSGVTVR